jgi:hypothetical protein
MDFYVIEGDVKILCRLFEDQDSQEYRIKESHQFEETSPLFDGRK